MVDLRISCWRRALSFAVTRALFWGVVLGGTAQAALAGYASIVIDEETGQVLNQVNADQLNHPASLTKMMTIYLALEAIAQGRLHWDQALPISEWAEGKSPTKLGLEAGDTISVRDCILGMITLSANDAATVVGEALGGNEANFARMMTAKAHELGMNSTIFRNASGLPDEEQVTTARDMATLARALYENFPKDYHYFSVREFSFEGRTIHGHNRLMYRYNGMDGLKTGFTNASGFNIATSAARDNHRLFGVVMGGQSAAARDNVMATLLDNAFNHRDTDPILVAMAGGQSRKQANKLLGQSRARPEMSLAALKLAPTPLKAKAARRAHPVDDDDDDDDEDVSVRATSRKGVLNPPVVTSLRAARWTVQIGAFSKELQAQQATQAAAQLSGRNGHSVQPMPPSKSGHVYRARLTGFTTEAEARNACAALKNKTGPCMVIPPGKSGVNIASKG